jgi:hypothetical protein
MIDVNLIESLFSTQFFLLSLFIWFLTHVTRTAVERFFRLGAWWAEVALPVLPVLIGILVGAAVRHFPFPEAVAGHWLLRLSYGGLAGELASKSFQLVRGVAKAAS